MSVLVSTPTTVGAFLRHMFLGVFGDVAARRRYISTEYLFDELSTSFANQQAKYNDSVSRAAGCHTQVVEFFRSQHPQERIFIGNERARHGRRGQHSSHVASHVGGQSPISIRHAISTIVDTRLDIDEVCSVGKTGILSLNTQQTKNIFNHTVVAD